MKNEEIMLGDIPETEDNIGIMDDLGKEIMESQKKQLLSELTTFQSNIKEIEKSKQNFKDQWDVDNRIYEIFLEEYNIKKLNPEFKYEESNEYWDLRKKQLEYKYRQDKHMSESRLEEYDRKKIVLQEQIDIINKKLEEMGDEE